jgi:hypothetical protein
MVYCEQMMMKEEEEDKEEGREDKISSSQTFIFLLFSQTEDMVFTLERAEEETR